MQVTPYISIVSPVYRVEDIVEKLVYEICVSMAQIDKPFEIILVDDRSPDGSWKKMEQLAAKYPNLTCIRLSRNFGQHPAIMAGLSYAKGEWVVVMDCDLQDQPKEIIKLHNKALEGYNSVLAKRTIRKDNFLKRLSSKTFSAIYSYLAGTKYDNETANFGIYNKKVINAVLQIGDQIKFFPLFIKLAGFSVTSISVEHAAREAGTTSYSYAKLISLAFNTIISFSNKPLKIFVKLGLLISMLSFFVGSYYIYLSIFHKISVPGFTSIMVSIWLLSGIIITTIGVCGIYIGKIFDQSKNRPVFIIDEVL